MNVLPMHNTYQQRGLLVAAILIIMIITVVIYYPGLDGEFIWDDLMYLENNPHIQKFSLENLKWMFTTLHLANWHPLTWISFALDYSWQGQLSPWGFHLTNIILHGLNSICLFFLTIMLINAAKYGVQTVSFYPQNPPILLGAFLTAILFSIHPQHIESVAWVSERKDVLSLFFFLLTLFFYIFYSKKPNWHYFLAALCSFLLSLMSKPMVVTLPAILLLLDIYPLRRTPLLQPQDSKAKSIAWYWILIEKIPFFILTLLSIKLTLFAQSGAMVSFEFLTLFLRIINAIHSVFLYISKFLIPIALSPLYIHPSYLIFDQDWLRISTLIAGFLLTTGLSAYLWYKKKYYFLTTWLFYLITLSPVIGIIQAGIQSSADRYAYLPTIPFYILIGTGTAYLYYKPWQHLRCIIKSLLAAGTFVIWLTLFNLSRDQLQIWQSSIGFWSYVVKVSPANAIAHHNLAAHYFFDGKYQQALEHSQLGIRFGYLAKLEQSFLAESLMRLNRFDEALAAYQNALKFNAEVKLRKDCVHYNMGLMYAKKGQIAEARQAFGQVIAGSPEYANAQGLTQVLTSNSFDQDKRADLFSQLPPCFSSSNVNSELESP